MTDGARLLTPDDVLLRRFGFVRAVGGAAYIAGVGVLFLLLGRQVWPLLLGVPVLAVVTTAYFVRSNEYPRASVVCSLVADALVLGGVVAYLSGAGSGLILLQAIVVVSAGLLLGPAAAAGFTFLTAGLGLAQFLLPQSRGDLDERLPIFLVSLAGLVSVGYLSGTYASRLHELIIDAGAAAEADRVRGRRGRDLLRQAAEEASESLRAVEELADQLEEPLDERERRQRSSALRVRLAKLDAEVSQLADVGSLMEVGEERPEPILLRRTVQDCLHGLGDRVQSHRVEVDVPPIRVVGYRRAARRVVLNLLENAVTHTPPGTRVHVTAVSSGARGVLVVTDDGPGIPPEIASRIFDPPGAAAGHGCENAARVGLPLVRQLCESMGAQVRYEPVPQGGSRFLVGFRLAPSAAPDAEPGLSRR
ncbi:MAG: sensor histidine kinase [Egibacteraceae bacterium]